MIRRGHISSALIATLAVVLASCASAPPRWVPAKNDLGAEVMRGDAPVGPKGACWASDVTPAVIETVTDRISEAPSAMNRNGLPTGTRQQIVRPQEKFWFRTPCEAELTPDVVATLQRALAARGFFDAPATGTMDAATKAAIRAYQASRGLNSSKISLTAARELGVIEADLGAALAE